MKTISKKLIALLLALSMMVFPAYAAEESTKAPYQVKMEITDYLIDFIRENGLYSAEGDDPVQNAMADIKKKDPEAYEYFSAFGSFDEKNYWQTLAAIYDADITSADYILNAMLTHYDSHSMYVPAGAYDTYFPSTDESYCGVGITMEQQEDKKTVIISGVNPKGSAFLAGVMAGDQLISVGGKRLISEIEFDEVADYVRGEEGTRVEVTVLRGDKEITFHLKRTQIGEPNFSEKDMGNHVYYMKFRRFSDFNTYVDFLFSLDRMIALNTRSLIIDVRGNPGGDLDMAIAILDRLIPDARDFFTVSYRSANTTELTVQSFSGTLKGPPLNKIVVLSDEGSASASEMLQASIVDTGLGIAVGTKTYGKARAQYHVPFEDGSAAVVTWAKLQGMRKVDYEGVGLDPYHYIKNTQAPHPAASCKSVTPVRLTLGNCSDDTELLNRALWTMGYAVPREKPYYFGTDTKDALNEFYLDHGMQATGAMSAQGAEAINFVLAELAKTTVTRDRQMEIAMEYAIDAAKAPCQYIGGKNGEFRVIGK